jgi:hypothetical protein
MQLCNRLMHLASRCISNVAHVGILIRTKFTPPDYMPISSGAPAKK